MGDEDCGRKAHTSCDPVACRTHAANRPNYGGRHAQTGVVPITARAAHVDQLLLLVGAQAAKLVAEHKADGCTLGRGRSRNTCSRTTRGKPARSRVAAARMAHSAWERTIKETRLAVTVRADCGGDGEAAVRLRARHPVECAGTALSQRQHPRVRVEDRACTPPAAHSAHDAWRQGRQSSHDVRSARADSFRPAVRSVRATRHPRTDDRAGRVEVD